MKCVSLFLSSTNHRDYYELRLPSGILLCLYDNVCVCVPYNKGTTSSYNIITMKMNRKWKQYIIKRNENDDELRVLILGLLVLVLLCLTYCHTYSQCYSKAIKLLMTKMI